MSRKGATTRRKSRKGAAGGHVATIPELKHAFDELDRKVAEILKAKASPQQQIARFQTAWRSLFYRPVSPAAAEAYLQVKRRTGRSGAGAMSRKKQRGGAAAPLAGAPLDHTTSPGTYTLPAGMSVPPYMSGALSGYDLINKDGLASTCGHSAPFPVPGATMGSNQAGGAGVVSAISDLVTSVTTRPFAQSIPTTPLYDFQTMTQGRILPASPAMEQNTPLKF